MAQLLAIVLALLQDAELDLDGRVQVEDIQVAHYWALGKWLTFQLRDATSILCWCERLFGFVSCFQHILINNQYCDLFNADYAKPHLNTTFRMHSDTVLAAGNSGPCVFCWMCAHSQYNCTVCPNCTSHTLTRTCSIAIVQVICYACYVLPAAKSWKAYWTQVRRAVWI